MDVIENPLRGFVEFRRILVRDDLVRASRAHRAGEIEVIGLDRMARLCVEDDLELWQKQAVLILLCHDRQTPGLEPDEGGDWVVGPAKPLKPRQTQVFFMVLSLLNPPEIKISGIET